MGTTRLKLYRGALRLCGAASIATLAENVESRRLLDEVWDDGGVRAMLEKASWDFALRTQQLDYDVSVNPQFGYRRAFSKSSDWVTTTQICADEFFNTPLLQYKDETQFLHADVDIIYVQFVSDHVQFGGDLSEWSQAFTDYAEAFFASKVIHRLTSDKQKMIGLLGQDMSGEKGGMMHQKLRTARSLDARQSPTKFLPPGSWVTARGGRGGGPMGDRGSNGSLIG